MEITNLTQTQVDEESLQKAAQAAFAVLGEFEVSLVLAGDEKIRDLNMTYRGKDKTTDVLSFEELNEIFISLPQAERQAAEQKIPTGDELKRLLVHGIVHLKGYDHEKSAEEAERMFAVEKKILERLSK